MAAPRQWGLTDPLSTALPTEKELASNDALIAELKSQNTFEPAEDTEKRASALRTLQRVTLEFVKHVGKEKGLAPSIVENAGGKVFTFGSYRLGVYGPGSDIDTLIVAPRHVTRDDFFEHFPDLLAKASTPGAIEELTPVPEAHVPIMKLEYSGISIDLIFAQLQVASVPMSLDLADKSLLRGLDETNLRSVNGTRVTDETLQLVPQTKTFRLALRAIKLWAQRRAVYANVVGFPGGIAWALMVARVCQLYPQATGSIVISKFFHIMKTWPWPMPVMLKDIEGGPLQVRVWNPQIYPGDKRHIMPIITPAYPSMCATHNITHSTHEIIKRELARAEGITNDIISGKRLWKSLFQKHSFFTEDYKYYLTVNAASRTKEAQSLWSGLVQSKVRRLVTGIEEAQVGVRLVHPFNKGFDRVHRCRSEVDVQEVLQGSLKHQAKDIKTETTDQANDIKQAVAAQGAADNMAVDVSNDEKATDDDGTMTIFTTTYYVGIELWPDAKTLDISFPVGQFKSWCIEWPQYNEEVNSVRIIHTRNYDLPADLFEPGETRPTKAKKKGAKQAQPIATKRSFSNTDMSVRTNEQSKAVSAVRRPCFSRSPLLENNDPNSAKRLQSGSLNGTLMSSNGTRTPN
ncbi:polynucleotide adenylyltransferase [Elasticomyces elasticus]|nr:polynucleotide adenylyltransferase [Elasticomyces elasticus]